ncbi:hypothetical protein [Dictyobacter aurantiacus]|uniref:Uncharacterized protein n=1 Tax=Dictyobacter aurantiacus TaxID=1936993 RepID=A0A401ZT91_9CHLR|nr:hypothetical protein [Dictyobacter aurantiacus]GCE07762.1 hypothetical protein KDAU_50910 [Dictyobacter aurantiacus]GCE10128.1 hypothetical protein KDAU_74570 [Dictyobacter aurantiacus]
MQEATKANPYVYADDDPVNKVDPSGKDAIQCYLELASVYLTGILGIVAGIVTVPEGVGVFLVVGSYALVVLGGATVGRSSDCNGVWLPTVSGFAQWIRGGP